MVEVASRFIPPEVVGEAFVGDEPNWDKLPCMPIQTFIHGLRERNWTSEFYDPEAVPWRVCLPPEGKGIHP